MGSTAGVVPALAAATSRRGFRAGEPFFPACREPSWMALDNTGRRQISWDRVVRRRRAPTCAALAFLVASGPALGADGDAPPSNAGESIAAQPRELARVRYRRGVEAFEENRFRDAIDLFLDADQLAPSAALSFNIAAAYEKIEQPASSLRWYRDYLRRAPAATDRAEVLVKVEKLEHVLAESGVQQLTVLSTPPAAALTVDGKAVGATPWTGELAPGPHELQLRLDAHSDVTRSIRLEAEHALDVAVRLERRAAAGPPVPAAPVPAPAGPHSEGGANGRGTVRTLGWIGLAAGGAALGGALVFEGLRRSAESAAEDERSQVGYAEHLDTMHGRQTMARVLLGAGGALAAAGGVLLILGREPARSRETGIAFVCGPGGCASTVRGSF